MSQSTVLGYWDFRGYGESCRYMLEYCGCDFEDKQFIRSSKSDYSSWRSVRENFGLDFPNLPYLLDGERKITESIAILKYIGRKYGLAPKTEEDTLRADILEGVLLDIRRAFYDIHFQGEERYRECATEFKNTKFLPKAHKIIKFMGERKWLVNDQPTYLDFMFYAQLSQQLALFPKILDGLERLRIYMTDFEGLPRVKQYLTSERILAKYPEHDPYIRLQLKIEDL